MTNKPWSLYENYKVVDLYFEMKIKELKKDKFFKKEMIIETNSYLDRSYKSIEFKLQNITAVLGFLKQESLILQGYAPLKNFQASLIDHVKDFLSSKRGKFIKAING